MTLNGVCGLLALGVAALLLTPTFRGLLTRRFRFGPAVHRRFLGWVTALGLLNLALWLLPSSHLLNDTGIALTLLSAFLASSVLIWLRLPAPGAGAAPARVVLAIGAHPDDLELACGGTLAKLTDLGHEVHAVVMSQGQVGGDRRERPAEARRAGRFLGLSELTVLDFPDTELASRSRDMVNSLEDVLREVRPDVILTHSASDQHQDHFAVHQATIRAARHHPSILCFESPSTTRSFNPSIFIDIEHYIHVKVRAVQEHRGQTGKPYMKSSKVLGMAAFRGTQAKREYAEAFEAVRYLGTTTGEL